MKAHLLFKDQDLDLDQPLPANAEDLIKDLELDILIKTMSQDDELIQQVTSQVILTGCPSTEAVLYRQEILRDCLQHPQIIREIYNITLDVIESKKKRWLGFFTHSASGLLYSAVEMMQLFISELRKLRKMADENAHHFKSEGFTEFFSMLEKELDDHYFQVLDNHLKSLRFNDGVMMSCRLGKGNEGTDYVLRKAKLKPANIIKRVLDTRKNPVYSFFLDPRDEAGTRALGELRDIGINLVANALAQSANHIDNFFNMLRIELAFYIGCLNLSDVFSRLGCQSCFPVPKKSRTFSHNFEELFDVCLALTMDKKISGNSISANGRNLVIITGANQGGKSTFLRSIGLAQLMMQCGMFVPAKRLDANLCSGLFTHYKREEDDTMTSGKLDEELARMSTIVSHLKPDAMILFNESFASTNEREGSEIARQITNALLEKHIKVFFVTHLYDFAISYYSAGQKNGNTLFLRAKRKTSGKHTYQLIKGKPLRTSFGADVYHEVFNNHKKPIKPQ